MIEWVKSLTVINTIRAIPRDAYHAISHRLCYGLDRDTIDTIIPGITERVMALGYTYEEASRYIELCFGLDEDTEESE
jgi:hypothetical protein